MPTSDNLVAFLIILVSVWAVMFIGQFSMININPDLPAKINLNGSIFNTMGVNQYNNDVVANTINPQSNLPTSTTSTSPTTGVVFTDSPMSMSYWWNKGVFGVALISNFVTAPANIIGYSTLPSFIKAILALLWAIPVIFLLALLFWGR